MSDMCQENFGFNPFTKSVENLREIENTTALHHFHGLGKVLGFLKYTEDLFEVHNSYQKKLLVKLIGVNNLISRFFPIALVILYLICHIYLNSYIFKLLSQRVLLDSSFFQFIKSVYFKLVFHK